MNINECNLDAKFFDDIFEKFHDDYEAQEALFDEMYNFLPNVPRVKEILGDATEKIVAEGKNWFAILQSDLGDGVYEKLDEKGLFPYVGYDYSIDNFIH